MSRDNSPPQAQPEQPLEPTSPSSSSTLRRRSSLLHSRDSLLSLEFVDSGIYSGSHSSSQYLATSSASSDLSTPGNANSTNTRDSLDIGSPHKTATANANQVPLSAQKEPAAAQMSVVRTSHPDGTLFPDDKKTDNSNYRRWLRVTAPLIAQAHDADPLVDGEEPDESSASRIVLFKPESDTLEQAANRFFSYVYGTQTETANKSIASKTRAIFNRPGRKISELYKARKTEGVTGQICILFSHVTVNGQQFCLITASGFYNNEIPEDKKTKEALLSRLSRETWEACNALAEYLNEHAAPGDLPYVIGNRPKEGRFNLFLAAMHLSLANKPLSMTAINKEATVNCAERARDNELLKLTERYGSNAELVATRPWDLPAPNPLDKSVQPKKIPPCSTCMSQVSTVSFLIAIMTAKHIFPNFLAGIFSCPHLPLITQLIVAQHQKEESIWRKFHAQPDHSSDAQLRAVAEVSRVKQETMTEFYQLRQAELTDTVLSPSRSRTMRVLDDRGIIDIRASLEPPLAVFTKIGNELENFEVTITAFLKEITRLTSKYKQLRTNPTESETAKTYTEWSTEMTDAIAALEAMRQKILQHIGSLQFLSNTDKTQIAPETVTKIEAFKSMLTAFTQPSDNTPILFSPAREDSEVSGFNDPKQQIDALFLSFITTLMHAQATIVEKVQKPVRKLQAQTVIPQKKALDRVLKTAIQLPARAKPAVSTTDDNRQESEHNGMGERLTSDTETAIQQFIDSLSKVPATAPTEPTTTPTVTKKPVATTPNAVRLFKRAEKAQRQHCEAATKHSQQQQYQRR